MSEDLHTFQFKVKENGNRWEDVNGHVIHDITYTVARKIAIMLADIQRKEVRYENTSVGNGHYVQPSRK